MAARIQCQSCDGEECAEQPSRAFRAQGHTLTHSGSLAPERIALALTLALLVADFGDEYQRNNTALDSDTLLLESPAGSQRMSDVLHDAQFCALFRL